MPLRRWGTSLSHAPFLVSLWRRFLYWPPASSFHISSSTISTCFRYFLVPVIALHTHALWPAYLRTIPPRRKSTSPPLASLEVLYAIYTDIRGSSIHIPPCLTLWPRIFQMPESIFSPPNSAGKNFSLRAFLMGTTRVPTTGTDL